MERDKPWRMKDVRDRQRGRQTDKERERSSQSPTLLIPQNEVLDMSVMSSWILRPQLSYPSQHCMAQRHTIPIEPCKNCRILCK